jgi:anthranilate 1,2-dioxygenase large subunit
MEDGCVGGFVERGIATAESEAAIVEMGGPFSAVTKNRQICCE